MWRACLLVMTVPLFQRIADGLRRGEEAGLRIRIFRLICVLTGTLCLGVVAPLNAIQHLPLGVHVSNIILGLMGWFCYWQSSRGRHFIVFYFAVLVVLLDAVWFWNAGSDGSVTHYFYPVMLFIIILFEGRWRWWLAVALWMNVASLLVVEHHFPHLVTPFQSAEDRLVDTVTGMFCSFAALAGVAWFMLISYNREQRQVSEIAGRLAESEANYREIFNSTNDALYVRTVDGRILDVNEPACALFGVPRSQVLGQSVEKFSLEAGDYSRAAANASVQLALEGQPQLLEWRCRKANGELFWAEVTLRAWTFRGEQRLVGSVRDITSRKQAQETLRVNEERLRLAMEASNQGWFELNIQTGESVSSPEYVRMLEYEPEDFRSNLQVWIERIHPADRTAVLDTYQRGLRGAGLAAVEYRQRTKSGAWKWIRSVARVVQRDAEGRPVRVMGTHTDVTERKELESQLLHSQRLEAVGTLASGVAHDLNNILTPVLMASGILRDKLLDPADRELMAMLDEGGRRGAAIVRQLLAFSRNLAQDRVPVDPRQQLRDMAQLMRSSFPKEIRIAESISEVPGLVEAEPNQLHQVLMNLCVNARDAMPGGGILTLGLERVQISGVTGARPGPHLVLSVADTGLGIPAEVLDKIFDPFFTTKPVGKGTGLGLASVHGIVKAHQGFVRVESQVGRGTVFRVFLPARDGLAPAAPAVAPPPVPAVQPTGTTTILVVDDDPSVLHMTSRFLQRLGHRVLAASEGPQALELLGRHRGEVSLVITDFSMPGMDGPALAVKLRDLQPGLPILGVSGLNQKHRATELAALGFVEVLAKPYELDDLLQALRRILSAGGGPR